MKKTKIICTMGPNTNDRELMKSLAQNGMDIARFNFSHGDYEEHLSRLELLRSVREELGLPIAALLDTKGPEIRTGAVKDDKKVSLKTGQEYVLTTEETETTEERAYINYSGLAEDVGPGNRILIDDGLLELEVLEVKETEIRCRVLNGGELGSKKGVNVPNVSIRLPGLTEKDKHDILFGIDQEFDFIAASFVRNADCIREIREILDVHGSKMKIVAKIENAQGIDNIDEIIEVSDGIMVARGDMGVEVPAEEVPHLQKMIIQKCNDAGKPVITATQMLDSMIRNPRPTRAEVTDVANAIYDGTDAVMLSGETAMGKYPVEALKMMVQVARSTEQYLNLNYWLDHVKESVEADITHAVTLSSVSTATMLGAQVILAPTMGGITATHLSKWRPAARIIGLSPNKMVVRQMQLLWGVTPVLASRASSTDELVETSVDISKKRGFVKSGDTVVITVGVPKEGQPAGVLGETNTMRVVKVD